MAMRKYSPNRCSQRSLPRVASEMALGTFCQRGPEPLAAQPVKLARGREASPSPDELPGRVAANVHRRWMARWL